MKDTFFFILLLFASYCLTLELESLSSNILENNKNNSDPLHLPQFSWLDPSSIQVIYPDQEEDVLHLRAADTVAEVVVRCLFSGNFEKETSGSFMVSGCMDDPYVYLTIYTSHLPDTTSFIWEHSGVIEPVVSPYTILVNETSSSEKDHFEDDGEQNIVRKRMKRGTFSYSDDSDDYSDYSDYDDYDDYAEDPEYSEPSNSSEYYDYNQDEEDDYDLAFDGADGPPPPIPSDLILPMNLAYDEKLLKQMNRNHSLAQQYVIEVASHGSLHMRHSSLSTRIHLQFMGPPQFLSGTKLGINRRSLVKVQKAKKNEAIPLIAFTKTDNSNKYMGVAFPGKDGGACHETKGTGILKWRSNPLVAAISFSHENGHMTGLRHDFREDKRKQLPVSNTCEGTGIMSRGDNNPNRPTQWSECSAIRIRMWYPKYGHCLVPAPICNSAEIWSTPCTCGTGNDSVACLSSHAYCVENHFGETPNQCLSTNDLKALAMPPKGALDQDEESISSRLMTVVGILLKESQLLRDKKTSQIIQQTKLIDMENLQRQVTNQESRLENQEKLMNNQAKRMKNQEKLIANQEVRLTNQENEMRNKKNEMKNQEKLMANQELRLTNQENELKNKESLIKIQGNLIANHDLRMTNYEAVMKNQEKLITELTNQLYTERNDTEVSSNETNLNDMMNPALENKITMLEKLNVLRTCNELEESGVNISGYYHLDPDGDKIGHPPIKAYCNFEDHVTEVLHEDDSNLEPIPYCNSNFCYTQEYTYSAHLDQITALMDLSTSCDQTIEYNCYGSPLAYGDNQFGVWVDRHGQDQIYFHGSNHGRHTCSCDSTNNCTGSQFIDNTCNCDYTAERGWMEDSGKLTNMTALPVMGFKYGPFMSQSQEAKIRIGRLRCRGKKEVGRIPHSCRDLKLLGETRPGLYHLQDNQHGNYPKMSFCQLDQPGYGDDLELESHWVKLSSVPGQVFFAVKQSSKISKNSVITFDITVSNEGQAMNPSSGIFTAPVDGVYNFKISGMSDYYYSLTFVYVYLNNSHKVSMHDYNNKKHTSVNLAWQFKLKKGDEVKLKTNRSGLYGDGSTYGFYFFGTLM